MKNIISTEFKNSTSYNLVKINDVDRDVRIVEESSIIKNPNKKRLLCYPDETINIGDIVDFDGSKWICTETDTTSQVSNVGLITRCNNNTLNYYDQFYILHEIPCIIQSNIILDTDETTYIESPSTTIILKISNNEITRQIKRGEIYKIGLQSYEIKDINDIVEPGILKMEIEYSQEVQEEHVYTISILNGDNLQIAQSQLLTINSQLTDNNIIVPSPILLYSSSNESIATINENGEVTVNSIGNVIFTVSMSTNITIKDTINVEIIEDIIHNFTVIINGTTSIIKGYTSNYSCIFKDNGNVIVQQSEFYLKGDDGVSSTTLAEIVSQDGINNTCQIKANNIGYVKLFVRNLDGSIISSGFRIQIKNLF